MTSFQSSELTELPVVENGQLFAQRAHSARYAPCTSQTVQENYATESKLMTHDWPDSLNTRACCTQDNGLVVRAPNS